MSKKVDKPEVVEPQQPNQIPLNINGEVRMYNTEDLSQEAVAAIQGTLYARQTVIPLLQDILRLASRGLAVEDNALQTKLPQKYEVVQQPQNTVSSESKNTNGKGSEDK